MDIFNDLSFIIGSPKEEFQKMNSKDDFIFIETPVLYAVFNGTNNFVEIIDLVFHFSDKERMIDKLINTIGYPIESVEKNWQFEKVVKSDFSETLIEKKLYKNIDTENINEMLKLDLLRWNYKDVSMSLLNQSLIRGFEGDYFYINIRHNK